MPEAENEHASDPVPLPIDGALDLHTIRPREVKEAVHEYLALCRERGILEVRLIHGKGRGVLRRIVWALLAKHPAVIGFAEASTPFGGWGATIVHLRPPASQTKASAGESGPLPGTSA